MEIHQYKSRELDYIAIYPKENPKESNKHNLVITLLHGFGADMYDLAGLCPEIDQNHLYILPNAPYEVKFDFGMVGRSWRNPNNLNSQMENSQSLKIINEEEELITAFMLEINEKFNPGEENRIIGGFSQGAGVASRYGLKNTNYTDGLMILSGSTSWLNETDENFVDENFNFPIFMGHGINDQMIPISSALKTFEILKTKGFHPEYHEYLMGHEINSEEINDIKKWLENFQR